MHESIATALAAGQVTEDQAGVIVGAVEALPAALVDPETRDRARAHLVGEADHHDARELRVLGRRVLDVVAPAVGE